MTPTGASGQAVAAVRFKAWKPPEGLHPTLEVDGPFDLRPLRFLVEALARRLRLPRDASGRAQLRHVPINAFEAEARRLARFEAVGHTAGEYEVPPEPSSLEFPLTLDLRRALQ